MSNKLRNTIRSTPGILFVYRLLKRGKAIARGRLLDRKRASLVNGVKTLATDKRKNFFCGYYDHSPFKPDNESLILIHSVSQKSWLNPKPNNSVALQLLNWQTGEVVSTIAHTNAWNWQQGARALWLDKDKVIFNTYNPEFDEYHAKLVDINSREERDLPIPVQEVDSTGRVYSLSYQALAEIRPDYGYRNHSSKPIDLDNQSIQQFNPSTGSLTTLIQVGDLANETESRYKRRPRKQKVNHLMVSPDAKHLAFLFRYFLSGKRVTDLYVMDLENRELRLVAADKGVSHACWWDNDSLVLTMHGPEGFGYYRVNHFTAESRLIWLYPDGHPGRLNKNTLLTDTYPDKHGIRHLVVRSLEDNTKTTLASSPEPLLLQGETRCDLHPSLSPSGRWIQVDCTAGHRRTIGIAENPFYAAEPA